MKKNRAIWILMIAMVSVMGFMMSCRSPLTDIIMNNSRALVYPIPTEPDPIGDSNTPLIIPLLAGKTTEIGTVTVWIEENSLYVQYNTSWLLKETHMDVVKDPANFPQTKKGNPKPGHFTYKMTHDPGISTYTYEVPMTGFSAGDTLYFAAHGEVEKWIEGDLVTSEGAWADGYGFPGANWATYFSGAMPEPVDVTGFWDMYWTPDGGFEIGPELLYLNQDGSVLEGSLGFWGTIEGNNVVLEIWAPFDPEPVHVILSGTLAGDLISGTFTGGMGEGTFRILRPSTAPFGHLDFECTIEGEQYSLDTDYAFGSFEGSETSFEVNFPIMQGPPFYDIRIHFNEMNTGTFQVMDEDPMEPNEVRVSLFYWEDENNHWEIQATAGGIRIIQFDNDKIVADFFDFHFPGGSYLTGDFNLNLNQYGGELTIYDGEVLGDPYNEPPFTNVNTWYEEWIWSSFSLSYEDNMLDTMIFFGVEGILDIGEYNINEEADILGFRWEIYGQGFENNFENLVGKLIIDSFSPEGIAGSFNTEPPYSFIGNFDVTFVQEGPPEG